VCGILGKELWTETWREAHCVPHGKLKYFPMVDRWNLFRVIHQARSPVCECVLPLQPRSGTRTHLGRQRSHLSPVTPGRHWQMPVRASHVVAPSSLQSHAERRNIRHSVIREWTGHLQEFIVNSYKVHLAKHG